jgi:hypothetical protein
MLEREKFAPGCTIDTRDRRAVGLEAVRHDRLIPA